MKTNDSVNLFLDLGLQPISNRFLSPGSNESVPRYPMRLILKKGTGSIHLERPFPVEEVRPRYEWLTCFEPEDHLDNMVEKILKLPGVNKNSIFGGYSFKDDSTLERLKDRGYAKQWRINPENDLGIFDPCASVETYQSVFNTAKAKKIQKNYGNCDVFIVRHVVEHAYDLVEFVSAICALICPDGYIVWELPDCERALNEGDCTTIWEEHVHYFTSFTFKQMLRDSGFSIIHYESVPYPLENSIVAITSKDNSIESTNAQTTDSVTEEIKRAYRFAQKVTERKKTLWSKLKALKESNGPIAMFGAGHLTVAFLSIMEVEELIDFVIDDNQHKKEMIMPVGHLEILGSDSLYSRNVGLCLLGLNPQNQLKIVSKHALFTEKGGKFASIFPGTNLDLERLI